MWLNRLTYEPLSEPILQGGKESPRGIMSFVGEIVRVFQMTVSDKSWYIRKP